MVVQIVPVSARRQVGIFAAVISWRIDKVSNNENSRRIKLYYSQWIMQIEFEQFVEQSPNQKVAVQKSLDETQVLFDALMLKYFG